MTPENGLLVDVGDVAEPTTTLETMLETAALHDPVRVRATAIERYSLAAVVDALEPIHERIRT